jgi:3-deoxy-D-manno-octulosonic-acid transferase
MRQFIAITLYRLILPLLFLAAFPGWLVKMVRRGGFGTRLGERAAIYTIALEEEPCGAVHFHAVSVGESLLALKLIREWLVREPGRRFVLATGTATGHAVATEADIPGLRVTYSTLDFRWMVRSYLNRFEPSQIVLVEGEVWPHLLSECKKRGVPVRLVNARMSPRSARRFAKFSSWLRPTYSLLDAVAIQQPEDAAIWQTLGISSENIHCTGSLKFDPGSGALPSRRPEFQEILDSFGKNRPVILAASTHPGEDSLIASAIREADPNALPVLVPRHAERRSEVKADLERAGFHIVLRSALSRDDLHHAPTAGVPDFALQPALSQNKRTNTCLVIDTTGELRDWTAHADAVVIGKSFLSIGGQNPCEAILAEVPVIFGPHMENFQPLASRLIATGGCISAADAVELPQAILITLSPEKARTMTFAASGLLTHHQGATQKILRLLS